MVNYFNQNNPSSTLVLLLKTGFKNLILLFFYYPLILSKNKWFHYLLLVLSFLFGLNLTNILINNLSLIDQTSFLKDMLVKYYSFFIYLNEEGFYRYMNIYRNFFSFDQNFILNFLHVWFLSLLLFNLIFYQVNGLFNWKDLDIKDLSKVIWSKKIIKLFVLIQFISFLLTFYLSFEYFTSLVLYNVKFFSLMFKTENYSYPLDLLEILDMLSGDKLRVNSLGLPEPHVLIDLIQKANSILFKYPLPRGFAVMEDLSELTSRVTLVYLFIFYWSCLLYGVVNNTKLKQLIFIFSFHWSGILISYLITIYDNIQSSFFIFDPIVTFFSYAFILFIMLVFCDLKMSYFQFFKKFSFYQMIGIFTITILRLTEFIFHLKAYMINLYYFLFKKPEATVVYLEIYRTSFSGGSFHNGHVEGSLSLNIEHFFDYFSWSFLFCLETFSMLFLI